MSSSTVSSPQSSHAHPNMVFRPLTPPSVALGGDERTSIKIHLLPTLRGFAVLISLITGILWIVCGAGLRDNPIPTATFVLVEILFLWNLLLVLAKCGHKLFSGDSTLPAMSCQTGCFQCSCGPDSDSTKGLRLENSDDDDSSHEPPSQGPLHAAWLIDLVLVITVFILVLYFVATWSAYQRDTRTVPVALTFVLIGFEIFIIILSPFKHSRSAVVAIYSEEYSVPARSGHIKLNRDVRAPRSVSISA